MNIKILKILFVFIIYLTPLFSKNEPHHTKSIQSIDKATTKNKNPNSKNSKISNTSNFKKSDSSKNQKDKNLYQKDTSQTISTSDEADKINDKSPDLIQEESKIPNKGGNTDGIETDFDGDIKTFGIFWQYQMYFGESQKHGIKTTSHLITYIQSKESYEREEPNLMSVGFDIKYLYDFWSYKKFILGINTGLGYQKTFLFDSKKYEATRNSLKSKEAISNEKYGFVGIVGIHTYYGYYQLEILSGYPNYFRVTLGRRF